jgi:hypothetical protein
MKENEDPADRAARLTANATVVMAVLTAFLFLANLGPLYEIIRGGKHKMSQQLMHDTNASIEDS